MKNVIRILWAFGLIIFASDSSGTAHADFIVTLDLTTTPAAGGLTLFSYSLAVDSASDQGANLLVLGVSPDADLTSLKGPAGWDPIYVAGDTAITWSDSGPEFDLLPGQMAIFSFLSLLSPGSQDYLILGGSLATVDGVIDGPSVLQSVPEPSSLAMLGMSGLFGLALLRRRGVTQLTATAGRSRAAASRSGPPSR